MTTPVASVKPFTFPAQGRVICVSDIHGEWDLLVRLLDKVRFGDTDRLLLLGDLFTKGSNCHATLQYIIQLCRQDNVQALRGNTDRLQDYLSTDEAAWLEDLPHIIEAEDFIFVHGGWPLVNGAYMAGALHTLPAWPCMKNDSFLDHAPVGGSLLGKWLVVGHHPTTHYCVDFPRFNPIVDVKKRVIAIDGGCVIQVAGQLNAFIIEKDEGTYRFSHQYVDNLPNYVVPKTQTASGGTVNIVWDQRFVERVEDTAQVLPADFCYVRNQSGRVLAVPVAHLRTDAAGQLQIYNLATDYCLPCKAGETVSLVAAFSDRVFAKKDGVCGWVML